VQNTDARELFFLFLGLTGPAAVGCPATEAAAAGSLVALSAVPSSLNPLKSDMIW
jgi:hypothetical protein